MSYTIREAELGQIPEIMVMVEHSRKVMRQNGNMVQWEAGYPSEELISHDINLHHGMAIMDGDHLVGYFAIIVGADPTYKEIEGGQWLDDSTLYGTVHRLCCAPGQHGIGRCCYDWCAQRVASLRTDTHADNTIMRHLMERLDFSYCGIIYLADGTSRMAYQKMSFPMVNAELKQYVEREILPRYNHFDAAHQLSHIRSVMAQSMELAQYYPQLDKDMVFTIAAYHDTGIVEGRERHHLVSGRIVREDSQLRNWFTEEQIETMAQAVEDHRASSHNVPRSLYGKIVAEADRDIEPMTILRRTVQYGLSNYPELDKEGHWQRMLNHLQEKYSRDGYLKLYIPESRNRLQQQRLWDLMEDKAQLRTIFEDLMKELN